MKRFVLIVVFGGLAACNAEQWSTERFESFLRNSGRFFPSDYDEDDAEEIPSRERDAIPLFADVMNDNGWSTNDLVTALIHVVSNGLLSTNWESAETKRTVAVAVRQLSDINNCEVTNYFASIIDNDLYGLEKIVVPAMFKYTRLEPEIMEDLSNFSLQTNRYDKVVSIVVWELLDCLSSIPEPEYSMAKPKVAKFLFYSMRQVTSSQTWQDDQLAKLIPSYSNSIQRLEQNAYFKAHSSRAYERERATAQFDRLNAIPTNQLNDVTWLLSR